MGKVIIGFTCHWAFSFTTRIGLWSVYSPFFSEAPVSTKQASESQ